MLHQCVRFLSDLSVFAIKNGYFLPFIIFLKSKNLFILSDGKNTYKILKQVAVVSLIKNFFNIKITQTFHNLFMVDSIQEKVFELVDILQKKVFELVDKTQKVLLFFYV